MFFKLIGNEFAKAILTKFILHRKIPHAILFSGPAGVGKKLFSLELAKEILGEAHIRKIDVNNHPDVRCFSPDGKTGMHSIASIHQLQELMSLEPFEASARVCIIDEADRMLPSSSNALLKTLEEPQKNNFILLLTQRPENIIPTIQSRCRKVPFFSISEKELATFLEKQHKLSAAEAKKIAILSHGSMEKAIELLDKEKVSASSLWLEILSSSSFCSVKHADSLQKMEQYLMSFMEAGESTRFFTEVDSFLEEIFYWFRDLYLIKVGASQNYIFHVDALQNMSAAAMASLPPLEQVGKCLEESRLAIQRSVRVKNVLEYMFMELSHKS
ncbi:MAG: AAA family ATPase [Chlamydiae bacterium]|nr:AAA family ATPase [Chlamydiota bacterium]